MKNFDGTHTKTKWENREMNEYIYMMGKLYSGETFSSFLHRSTINIEKVRTLLYIRSNTTNIVSKVNFFCSLCQIKLYIIQFKCSCAQYINVNCTMGNSLSHCHPSAAATSPVSTFPPTSLHTDTKMVKESTKKIP